MNVLFILGNGFDINLGLHTGYQDFYDYYLQTSSEDEEIEKIKRFLERNRYTTWADLEMGLGSYTTEVDSLDQMKKVYCDIGDSLRDYLKKEEESFSVTDEITNAVVSGLLAPHSYLSPGLVEAIDTFRRGKGPYQVDVISFNYTNTLEKVLKSLQRVNSQIQLGFQTSLRYVNHIHMRLEDGDVVMGVNDDSQILNKKLLDNKMRSLLVKPYINQHLQNLNDARCAQLINEADQICLFGVSIGETDLMWWQAIGKRFQKAFVEVLLFAYDDDNAYRNFDLINKYDEYKAFLFNRMGVNDPSENQMGRVFVGYKTGIFGVGH